VQKKRYKQLEKNYKNYEDITIVNEFVGSPKSKIKGKRLDDILRHHSINIEKVDFVSIDIDGPDLEIAMDLGFKPAVLLIEGGSNFSPLITNPLNLTIASNNLQHPFGYIYNVCKNNGYKIVAFHQDSYLVRNDLSSGFKDLDAETLYSDSWNFLTNSHRNSLLELRQSNTIRDFEQSFFKTYKNHPLKYNI
tara:strand:- start:750 stop:1325 length:576 start_codon:yes stop_codon:yes gene_type:complete